MSTNTAAGAERPRPKRLYIPIAVRRDAARRQGGVCPCGCGTPCWADAKETRSLVEWDHSPALRRRDVNEAGTDYVPAQLDPAYIVGRCEASHLVKTSGAGATTAGSDIGAISKGRRRLKKDIRNYLSYDKDTGIFTWIKSPNARAPKGSQAGTECYGYRQIGFRGKIYPEHILAWWWMTGKWPKRDIDHENRDGSDNRWENLRLATKTQNNGNCGPHRRNTSGFKGVTLHSGGKGWVAQIGKSARNTYIGIFKTKELAAAAYDGAAKKHFGKFAYLNGPKPTLKSCNKFENQRGKTKWPKRKLASRKMP